MRRRGRGFGRVVGPAAAGLLVAVLLPGLVGAQRPSRAAALRAQQAALVQREHAAVLELYAAESRLSRSRATLASLQSRAAALARERAATRRRARAVSSSLATLRVRLNLALRSLYQEGEPDPVAILFGAQSLDDAVARLDGLRAAARTNRRLIAALRTKQAALTRVQDRLALQTDRLRIARRHAEAAVAALSQAASLRTGALASLRVRRSLTQKQLASLDALARKAERRSATLARQAAPAVQPAPEQAPTTAPAQPPVTATAPVAGTRTLVVDAVAYHLGGHTASGLPVGVGVVAVDPTVIPLGTKLFVPGYGPAVAADVGSAVKGAIIDLWMPSRAKALAWGRRTVTITVYG